MGWVWRWRVRFGPGGWARSKVAAKQFAQSAIARLEAKTASLGVDTTGVGAPDDPSRAQPAQPDEARRAVRGRVATEPSTPAVEATERASA